MEFSSLRKEGDSDLNAYAENVLLVATTHRITSTDSWTSTYAVLASLIVDLFVLVRMLVFTREIIAL